MQMSLDIRMPQTPKPHVWYDDQCRKLVVANPNMAVPWMLMAAYAYYIRDTGLITDGTYDWLANVIRTHWATITHRHRDLVAQVLDQQSTTLFELGELDYPLITRSAACQLCDIREPKFFD